MKKIKTLFAFLMIFTMVLGLAACGNTNSNGTSSAQTSEAQNTSEETVTTAEKESDDNSAATEETSDTAAGADSTNDHASAENTSVNLSKLWEPVEDRGGWCTAVHGVIMSWT